MSAMAQVGLSARRALVPDATIGIRPTQPPQFPQAHSSAHPSTVRCLAVSPSVVRRASSCVTCWRWISRLFSSLGSTFRSQRGHGADLCTTYCTCATYTKNPPHPSMISSTAVGSRLLPPSEHHEFPKAPELVPACD